MIAERHAFFCELVCLHLFVCFHSIVQQEPQQQGMVQLVSQAKCRAKELFLFFSFSFSFVSFRLCFFFSGMRELTSRWIVDVTAPFFISTTLPWRVAIATLCSTSNKPVTQIPHQDGDRYSVLNIQQACDTNVMSGRQQLLYAQQPTGL